jgi:hypothetical protein
MIERETIVYLFAPKPSAPPPSTADDGSIPLPLRLALFAMAAGFFFVMGFGFGLERGKLSGPHAPTVSGTPGLQRASDQAPPVSTPSGPPPSFTTR